ncbi:MAG: UvrD-helicase domain-containing protein, partial [Acidobacteriota bacterium]
ASTGLERILAAEPAVTAGLTKQSDQLRSDLAELSVNYRQSAGTETAERAVRAFLTGARTVLLTSGGTLRVLTGKKDSKAERQHNFATEAAELLDICALADLVDLFQHNVRLLRHGLRALDIFDELKRRDRCVDFQDLEQKAWNLLRGELGLEVQYRFDEAIDHLLIDEFQDTNRNQWEILRPFAEEFLAGESARQQHRTVFLVGDGKQSIYGFRGADPSIFLEVAHWIERQAGSPVLSLPTNFRSLPAVVESVGMLMAADPLVGHLPPGEAETARQAVARGEAAGKVFFLPVYQDERDEQDEQYGRSGDQLAAAAAVDIVRHLTSRGVGWLSSSSPLDYGDILVLCRSRSHITQYEQAFRQADIPIVPAGRGLLARSREVRDILHLLRWLTYSRDDTALASVLRSPLCRIDEATLQRALVRVHSGRGEPGDSPPDMVPDTPADSETVATNPGGDSSLWAVLRNQREELGLGVVVACLESWLNWTGFRRCHCLLRDIYRTGQVLERFAAALGEQARYNLLRLLDLALSPELGGFPTVREFANLIQRAAETATEEEATLPDQSGGRVRLVTVHGAKGLEAPVVLLVDADAPMKDDVSRLTLSPDSADSPLVYGVSSSHLKPPGKTMATTSGTGAAVRTAGQWARFQARREETNILYVALTRARDALFVLGAETSRKGERQSYLDWIQAAARKAPSAAAAAAEVAAAAVPESDSPGVPFELEAPAWLTDPDRGVAEPTTRLEPSFGVAGKRETYRVWEPPPKRPALRVEVPSAADEILALDLSGGPAA